MRTKRKNIILTAVIFFVCLICIAFWQIIDNKLNKNSFDTNLEDLKTCYIKNAEKFNAAANTIVKHPSITRVNTSHDTEYEGYYYYKTNNYLFIESKEKLDDEKIQDVENSLSSIFSGLKFRLIVVENGEIYFIKWEFINYEDGIVYTPLKREPSNMYIIKTEKINDQWYCYQSR